MKASESAACKVKRSEKIGDLHKDSGLSGSNGLAKLSRHIEPSRICRGHIRTVHPIPQNNDR